MKRPAREFRNRTHWISSFFIAIACAPLLPACANATAEEAPSTEAVAPGSIEVKKPLELAERARVPEKETGFLSAEVTEHGLVITHDGRLPAFAAGDVLGGTQGGGYLVRVAEARALPGKYVLGTEPAALTELIREGEIHIHYDALEYSKRIQDSILAEVEGDEDGEEVGSAAQALQVGGAGFVDLIRLSGAALPASCGIGARGKANIDVSATLIPSIDLDLKIGAKGGGDPRPELKRLRLVASGMLQVDTTLHATGTVHGSCSIDLLKLAGGVPGVPLPALTFWVGPVPVVVTTEVVPVANARVELAFEAAEVTADAHALAGLEAGVEYQDAKWAAVWDPWATGSGTATLEAPGEITASCKVSAGAELRARLYGILGPTVGVEAFARASAETAPPYCTYEGRVDGGVRAYAEAEAGVSVGPLDLTLVSLPLVDYEIVRFDGPQFSGEMPFAPETCAEL